MAETFGIKVEKVGDWEFRVEIQEDRGKTAHEVVLDQDFAGRFDVSPEEVVKKSFEFLLAREPKESILSSFSIPDTISHYFPDFESKIVENE